MGRQIHLLTIKIKTPMTPKQTAVEWFNEEINKLNVGTDARVFIAKLFQQAKEMEKERLKHAYDWGETNGSDECNGDGATHENFEQYFEETYKSE
jgi:hypothetical protein